MAINSQAHLHLDAAKDRGGAQCMRHISRLERQRPDSTGRWLGEPQLGPSLFGNHERLGGFQLRPNLWGRGARAVVSRGERAVVSTCIHGFQLRPNLMRGAISSHQRQSKAIKGESASK